MNKKDKMSYKDFVFMINPNIIRIKHSAKIVSNSVPFGTDDTKDLGRKACKINGSGEFIGSDCMEQFAKLRGVFLRGGSGLLLLPGFEPFYAFFESLELLEEISDKLVRYSFSFCEDTSAKHFESAKSMYHTVENEESLWDISYKYNVAVEELIDNNPNIMRPDLILKVGEVVRL